MPWPRCNTPVIAQGRRTGFSGDPIGNLARCRSRPGRASELPTRIGTYLSVLVGNATAATAENVRSLVAAAAFPIGRDAAEWAG